MSKRGIEIGTLVEVVYNHLSSALNVGAKKYAGTRHRVTKIVQTPLGYYYELDGAVGENNVPYAFMRDELMLVRE